MSQVWRVLVVDGSRYFDENLWQMIASSTQVEIVGLARSGHDALAQTANLAPDLVLVDVSDGKAGGLPTIRALHQRYRRLPIIALAPLAAAIYGDAACQAGAVACLPKAELVPQLASTIRQVMSPIPAVAFFRAQTVASAAAMRSLLTRELPHLPQHLIGAGLGLIGGATGVLLAISLALVIQISLPPSVVFLPGLVPLMMIALLAGWGAASLLSRGVVRVSPNWFRGQRERIWPIASACATGSCLFQIVFFTLR